MLGYPGIDQGNTEGFYLRVSLALKVVTVYKLTQLGSGKAIVLATVVMVLMGIKAGCA